MSETPFIYGNSKTWNLESLEYEMEIGMSMSGEA